MELYYWIRIILLRWKSLILFPILSAFLVFFLTRNAEKEYISSGLIYTGIGSGFNITSSSDDRLDYYAFNVAFDNLMATVYSRECIERTALDLLAWRLTNATELEGDNFADELIEIKEAIGQEIFTKASLLSQADFRKYLGLQYDSLNNQKLIKFLNDGEHNYDVNTIRKTLKVTRKQTSDMLELVYTSNHPKLVKQTLIFVIENFTEVYKNLKIKETRNVVDYFRTQFEKSKESLRKKEKNVRRFGTENRIINYYEQTKFIAEGRENTEELQFKYENDLAAAENAIDEILKKIDKNNAIFEISQSIKDKRQELVSLNYQLANLQLSGDTTSASAKSISREIDELENLLKEKVVKMNNFNYSEDGIKRDNLLRSWLENVIDYDKAEARLKVIDRRLQEFDEKYDRFAPLGSTLKGLEREVDIAEKDYLQNLVSLNEAILRQKNLDLSSSLTTVDPPFLPQKPESTHRLLLVVFAGILTGFLILAYIIAAELLDNALRTSANLKRKSGLETLISLPNFNAISTGVDEKELKHRIHKQISNGLLIRMLEKSGVHKRPKYVGVISQHQAAGKSFLMSQIESSLRGIGVNANFLLPSNHTNTTDINNVFEYDVNTLKSGVSNKENTSNFLNLLNISDDNLSDCDFVFIEFPGIVNSGLPLQLLTKMDFILIVTDASKTWTKADSNALDVLKQVNVETVMAALNNVRVRDLENDLGEIPRERSKLRRAIKNLFTKLFKRA